MTLGTCEAGSVLFAATWWWMRAVQPPLALPPLPSQAGWLFLPCISSRPLETKYFLYPPPMVQAGLPITVGLPWSCLAARAWGALRSARPLSPLQPPHSVLCFLAWALSTWNMAFSIVGGCPTIDSGLCSLDSGRALALPSLWGPEPHLLSLQTVCRHPWSSPIFPLST